MIGTLATGDFDGDSRVDLAYVIRTLDTHPTGGNNYLVRFQYGAGDGSFAAPVDVSTYCDRVAIYGGHTTIAADFNADGRDDYVCTGPDTGLQVMQGAAGAAPAVVFDTMRRDTGDLFAFDVNEDGRPDVFDAAGTDDEQLRTFPFYANSGTGFSAVGYFGFRETGATGSVNLGDFDGDGRTDMLLLGGTCADPSCFGVGVYKRVGAPTGGFVRPTAYDAIPDRVFAGTTRIEKRWSTAVGDVDNDLDLDLIVNSATDFVQVMTNDGTGRFAVGAAVTVGTQPVRVAMADFDQDGYLDIASVDQGSKTLTVAFGLGGGAFGSASTPGARWKQITLDRNIEVQELRVAEFNGNRFPDIALADNETPRSGSFGLGSIVVILDPGQ